MSHTPSRWKIYRARLVQRQRDERSDEVRRLDAAAVVAGYNAQLAAGIPLLWEPNMRCVLESGHPWLHVACSGCSTVKAVDLRMVKRPPDMIISQILPRLVCQICGKDVPSPTAVALTAEHDG